MSKIDGRAALLLASKADRSALPALYQAALDLTAPADTRARVMRAIAELVDGRDAFDESAMATFAKLEQDADHLVRGYLARTYWRIGGLVGQERLQKMANDRHAWVREQVSDPPMQLAGVGQG